MTDRISQALDGDLPTDDLTTAERAAVAAFDRRNDALRQQLGRGLPADLDERIMHRIRAQGLEPLPAVPDRPIARIGAALWSPRDLTLRLRPAYGLAAAAVAALALFLGGRSAAGPAAAPAAAGAVAASSAGAATAPAQIFVQFRLDAKEARAVALAGSFTDWQPAVPMQKSADGVWTVTLPITPGVHDYAFVVDGTRWMADPYAPGVEDGFGGTNSRLTLLAPGQNL